MTSRRAFVHDTLSCAGHLALAATLAPGWARRAWAASSYVRVVAREPFGRLEEVAEGIWAVISTPLAGDSTTVANGGLIAGRDGVMAIEGFNTTAGARWLGEQSRRLTGRWPSHVVCTHYHADHTRGVAGYATGDTHPGWRATSVTRDLVVERNGPFDRDGANALAAAILLSPSMETTVDLGGRVVRLTPRLGHTASDVTVAVDEPAVVFCGDLVWNGMFPNYVDARPVALVTAVRALRGAPGTRYVPGHGALAGDVELQRYLDLLEAVEQAARQAIAQGTDLAAAAAAWRPPASLGDWTLFGPAFLPRAFAAWQRELASR